MSEQGHQSPGLTCAVASCRADRAFMAELARLYAAVDTELSRGDYRCKACGDCCDFAKTGHRLYVSAGELAFLTEQPPITPMRVAAGRCPYQSGEICTARDRRALGCRVFFCDKAGRQDLAKVYERHHAAIRRLHDVRGLAYLYVELTSALAELLPAALQDRL